MEIIKTLKYLKSLKNIPKKHKDTIEAEVDRLETDLTGVIRIEGTRHQARLDVGDYRVFLTRQKGKVVALIVEEAVRRTTTTYRKKK
jgi:mRNA-degrading endonuclease RelE of RelBE toxin-antitoxin system